MRYSEISKEMSSLYFGLDAFCQLEARVPEFEAVFSIQRTLYSPQLLGGQKLDVIFWDSSLK